MFVNMNIALSLYCLVIPMWFCVYTKLKYITIEGFVVYYTVRNDCGVHLESTNIVFVCTKNAPTIPAQGLIISVDVYFGLAINLTVNIWPPTL